MSKRRNDTGTFTIEGQIIDQLDAFMPGLFVEAFDSDFGSEDDFLGNAVTDENGLFEISFGKQEFNQQIFEIFERRPDIYLVISDEYRTIHRTEIRSEAKNGEYFDITITETRPFVDPYVNSLQRMLASFGSVGQTVDVATVDQQRTPAQLLRTIGSWLRYTDPNIARIYGYPGAQVLRHPKEFPSHNHSIPWRKTSEE